MPPELQRRIIISAVCLSPPGTMGGNTKIALEVARQFSHSMKVVFLVPEEKVQTIASNIAPLHNIELLVIRKYRYHRLIHLVEESVYYLKESKRLLESISCSEEDLFFTPSDFHLDVFLGLYLKATFKVQWIASVFLFVPNPFENIVRGYGFPFIKYVIYYSYQRLLVCLIKLRSNQVVITNDLDRTYFSPKWKERLFAFYGGVNIEQVTAIEHEPIKTKFDLVFCSRLCAQKGITQLLDIWRLVVAQVPTAKLAVIGNGAPLFEKRLKDKATLLNISHTIEWLGYVNNQEKYRIYRASRLFVHPTVYDNNGMVAAEALCTGLPVVMNDLDNLKDVYNTGCVKSNFSDYETTANTIVRLLTDPITYNSVSPTSAEINGLCQKWDWAARCSEFERFLFESRNAMQSTSQTEDPIVIISVVRDYNMYNHCIVHNLHANVHTLHTIDNRTANEHISIQYNRFLDTYDYNQPAWFIFCHEDFEMLENPEKLLKKAHQDSLYGPIGATTKTVAGCFFKWQLLGTIYEAGKDGMNSQQVGGAVPLNTLVETFDCQCLIVHSSLIFKTGLRFDPRLSFDLYVEDFCIQAKERHSISSLIFPIRCKHWSHGRTGARYFQQEEYLNAKYQNCCYTGTSSYSLGKPPLLRRLNALLKKIIKKIVS